MTPGNFPKNRKAMEDTPDWIVSTIDNKIVSVSLDYRIFTDIMRSISWVSADSISEIRCTKVPMEEIMRMARTLAWEDLRLFGSDFQKMVWKKLFGLTHREGAREYLPDTSGRLSPEEGTGPVQPRLMSYTDFAAMCGKSSGARAVAHAVGQNPVAIIIPCHLIVPKETMDRLAEIERQAENSLFGTDGLILDPGLDFGEYRYGKEMKKKIILETFRNSSTPYSQEKSCPDGTA